jgi:hypothetical protein
VPKPSPLAILRMIIGCRAWADGTAFLGFGLELDGLPSIVSSSGCIAEERPEPAAVAVICFEWLQRPETVVAADLARLSQQACGRMPYASSITRTKRWFGRPTQIYRPRHCAFLTLRTALEREVVPRAQVSPKIRTA